jgi:hypothetical protein
MREPGISHGGVIDYARVRIDARCKRQQQKQKEQEQGSRPSVTNTGSCFPFLVSPLAPQTGRDIMHRISPLFSDQAGLTMINDAAARSTIASSSCCGKSFRDVVITS